MKNTVPLLIIFVSSGVVVAQSTSNRLDPTWTTGTHWTAGAPGYDMVRSATLAHNSTVTNEIIVKNNYTLIIEAGVTLTTDQAFTIKDNTTVIIRGTLRGTDGGKEFKIEGNANLIVESGGSIDWAGKWTTNDSSVDIVVDGSISVGGDFNNKGDISGSGTIEVDGDVNNDGGDVFGCTDGGDNCCTTNPCALGAVLPIKLLFFTAGRDDGMVHLRWATTMEENFLKFIVQHSTNGTSYEDIGEVHGKGFDIYEFESNYSFQHRTPLLGFNYYRLKAVDLDDSYEYFAVKLVKVAGHKSVTIYPNPTRGKEIAYTSNFSPSELDRVMVINQMGVVLLTRTPRSKQGSFLFPAGLPPGDYFLRYLSDSFEQTARIVVAP